MFKNRMTVPELGFIAITRIALGAGIGLLLSGKLRRDRRKAAGLALAVVGAITTIPFVMRVRNLRRGYWEKRSAA